LCSDTPYKYSRSSDWVIRPFVLGQAYENTWNPYWNVIITFATVGYGDIYPRTNFGRLFAILSMFFGQFLISLIIIAMSISAMFTLEETKAFKDIKVFDYHQEQLQQAGRVLTSFYLKRLCERNYPVKRYIEIGNLRAAQFLKISYIKNVREFSLNAA
jgi:hypothetical protein